jgi:tetratricopeptide (TPR) repeat protein
MVRSYADTLVAKANCRRPATRTSDTLPVLVVLSRRSSHMASGTNEGTLLRWVQSPAAGFEDVDASRTLAFDAGAWTDAVDRLRPGAGPSYLKLARAGDFGPWWSDKCGGESTHVRRFRLQLPSSVWERPWEGLVGALDPPRWDQVSLIRQIEADASPPQPSELSEPLSIVCLQGAAAGPGLDLLDLAAEFEAVKTGYANLDLGAREAVVPPKAVRASLDSLPAILLEHRPTILWFSGHGRDNPAGLLLADNHWLTPEDLCSALISAAEQGGRTPLYVILWACQTGSAAPFAVRGPAPEFISALQELGVAAILASQAPLSDKAALVAARHVLAALTAGRPLDHALARVRAVLMRQAGQKLGDVLDWMCPVIWSKGAAPPALSWTDRREYVSQRQAAAHKLVPATIRGALAEDGQVDISVKSWPDVSRLWVRTSAPAGGLASRMEWARRTLALLKSSKKTILWFDLFCAPGSSAAIESQLGAWGEMVSHTIEHDDDHSELIRTAASLILKSSEQGWRSLCNGEAFIIAILDPPASAPAWLWDGIRNGKAQTVVLSADYPEARVPETWTVESVEQPQAAPDSSKTLAALAVLGCPADREDIESASEPIGPWLSAGFVLETAAGCVMPAGVSVTIGSRLSAPGLAESHRLAHTFLDGAVARRKLAEGPREDILLARWHHAQAAGWTEKVSENATYLLDLYERQRRAGAFIEIFEQVTQHQREFPDRIRIGVGWAYLMLGDSKKSISWLDELLPDEIELPSDAASWYLVRAEAEKSSGLPGSKQKPRVLLQEAEKVLKEDDGEANRSQFLRCQHDLARLTHFFEHNPAAAISEYKHVADEWNKIPHARLDQAIALRNLSEALMDLGPDHLPEAEAYAAKARRIMPEGTRHIVYSELEYLAGRIATRRQLPKDEIIRRFVECREKALLTNHMMMAAIVESRLYWLDDRGKEDPGNFEEAKWQAVGEKLGIFEQHVWAARVLVDGHLRAARRFGGRGERGLARKELSEARRLVDANPAFAEGSGNRAVRSDKRRIAILYAGIATYESETKGWQELSERYPEWAPEWQSDFPQKIWELAG